MSNPTAPPRGYRHLQRRADAHERVENQTTGRTGAADSRLDKLRRKQRAVLVLAGHDIHFLHVMGNVARLGNIVMVFCPPLPRTFDEVEKMLVRRSEPVVERARGHVRLVPDKVVPENPPFLL